MRGETGSVIIPAAASLGISKKNKNKTLGRSVRMTTTVTTMSAAGGTMTMTGTFKIGEDRMRSTNTVAILDAPEPVRRSREPLNAKR